MVDLGDVGASLNEFMAAGPALWERARERLDDAAELDAPELAMPFEVADYVDFYSSLHHAGNVGRMFRPDAEPLLPNWTHMPVGYHGRAGERGRASGTPARRPPGQLGAAEFGPTRALDVEVELGFVIGVPVRGRCRVERVARARLRRGLVNDWSARDIEGWEYRPLGPMLGKSFATSVVELGRPLPELAGLRVEAAPQDPEPLPYLREPPWALRHPARGRAQRGGGARARRAPPVLVDRPADRPPDLERVEPARGRPARHGDDLGPEREQRGCLLELTWAGRDPIELTRRLGAHVPGGRGRGGAARRAARRGARPGHGGLSAEVRCRPWPRTSSRWRSPPRAPGDYAPAAGSRAVEAVHDGRRARCGARASCT